MACLFVTNDHLQYIPRNMHTVFALLCFVVVIHWLIFPYPSGLLHWHCGNLTIAPVPAKQPWWIWIDASCEFIMNDCITTTKQSTTKPCAYFLGYTVPHWRLNPLCLIIEARDSVYEATIGSANGLTPIRHQANFCWLIVIGPQEISVKFQLNDNFPQIPNTNRIFYMLSSNLRPFCIDLNVWRNGNDIPWQLFRHYHMNRLVWQNDTLKECYSFHPMWFPLLFPW